MYNRSATGVLTGHRTKTSIRNEIPEEENNDETAGEAAEQYSVLSSPLPSMTNREVLTSSGRSPRSDTADSYIRVVSESNQHNAENASSHGAFFFGLCPIS